VTLKFDSFPLPPLSGMFVGADYNYVCAGSLGFDQTHERTYWNLVGLGPRLGLSFNVGRHLHISPWARVDYQFNASDVRIAGRIFHQGNYSIFPAVHLGSKF
jgi:hypothetical protein